MSDPEVNAARSHLWLQAARNEELVFLEVLECF